MDIALMMCLEKGWRRFRFTAGRIQKAGWNPTGISMKRCGLNRAMSTVPYKLEGKVKKKLMIVLLVAAGVIILYHALFYRAKMNKSYVNQLEKEYGEYILFTAYEFDWAIAVPWLFSDDGIFGVFNALSRSFITSRNLNECDSN